MIPYYEHLIDWTANFEIHQVTDNIDISLLHQNSSTTVAREQGSERVTWRPTPDVLTDSFSTKS